MANLPFSLYDVLPCSSVLFLLSPAQQPIFNSRQLLDTLDSGRPFFSESAINNHRSSAPQETTLPPTKLNLQAKIKMQFSVVAVAAFMATSAYAAESTVYMTEKVTITSCAASVTNCPARSTVTSLTSYPVITSSAVPEVSTTSAEPIISSSTAVSYGNTTVPAIVAIPSTATTALGEVSSPAPAASSPVVSVITISKLA